MKSGAVSTGLGDDAAAAYHRLRHEAQLLGTISSSFEALAGSVTAAYLAALTAPEPESWTALVTQTAVLVDQTNALRGIVPFGAKETEALAYFESLVHENADLLVVPAAMAIAANARAADAHRGIQVAQQ